MEIQHVEFNEIPEGILGFVILGAQLDNKEQCDQWITNVTKHMQERGACDPECTSDEIWDNVYATRTKGGRIDLTFHCTSFKFSAMPFTSAKREIRNCLDVNEWMALYAVEYGSARRGPLKDLSSKAS